MTTHANLNPPHCEPVRWELRTALFLVLLLFVWGRVSFGQAPAADSVAGQAIQAQNAGNASAALRLYREALGQSPGWTDGWWRYGGMLYESKQYAVAGQAFARLTELAPENSLGFALLGLCEFEQSDWDNARLHLNKALNHGKLPAEIAQVSTFDLGLVLLHLNNRDGAIVAFKLLMHQAPNYPDLALALGAAELNFSSLPTAHDHGFEVAQLAGAAAVAVVTDQPKEAERLYRQLIEEHPSQSYAHFCLGLFFESEHRDDEAQKEFHDETLVNPGNALPWIWIARVALLQQDPKTARSALAHSRDIDPHNPIAFLIEGRSFMLEHQWEQALVPLQEAEKRAPQSSEVHYALASTYSALHRVEAAKMERQLFLQASQADAPAEGSANQ